MKTANRLTYSTKLAESRCWLLVIQPATITCLSTVKMPTYSLQMIINHDDSVREYDYQAEKMKTLCQKNGWHGNKHEK